MMSYSSAPPLSIPVQAKCNCKCGRKCPCVVIGIDEVETLTPDSNAYVHIEKDPNACEYGISFGIPSGKTGECDISIVDDGIGCYLMAGTDGKSVRCCLVPDGESERYRWECVSADVRDTTQDQ